MTGAVSTYCRRPADVGWSTVASASNWSHRGCDSIVSPSRAIPRACRSSGRWSRDLFPATSPADAGAYRRPRTSGRAASRSGPGAVSTQPLHAQRYFFR
jgi:hypothetical protein